VKNKIVPYIGLLLTESILLTIYVVIIYGQGLAIEIIKILPLLFFVFLGLSIFGLTCYAGGFAESRRRYEGRPFENLEFNIEHKILSSEDGLGESGELTYSWLQKGKDKGNIVGYVKNGCWLKNLKKGDIITQKKGCYSPEKAEEKEIA